MLLLWMLTEDLPEQELPRTDIVSEQKNENETLKLVQKAVQLKNMRGDYEHTNRTEKLMCKYKEVMRVVFEQNRDGNYVLKLIPIKNGDGFLLKITDKG